MASTSVTLALRSLAWTVADEIGIVALLNWLAPIIGLPPTGERRDD